MARMKFRAHLLVLSLLVGVLWGCSGAKTITVEVPPMVNLRAYQTVGVLDVEVNNQSAALQQDATRKFIATLQNAQPGVRVLELGSQRQLLQALGKSRLDAEAIKAICRQNAVDALLVSQIETSAVNPTIKFGEALTSLSAKAVVNASMNAKLYEMPSGASLWSDVVSGKWTIAGFNLSETALSNVRVNDLNDKYSKMISDLVYAVTKGFRPTYRKERVTG